jgi:hypothetical protein
MPTIDQFIGIVLGVLMFGFIAGAVLMGLGAFRATMTPASYEANATGDILEFAANFAAQLPTVGTVLGALMIVAVIVIVMAGGYMAYQKYA